MGGVLKVKTHWGDTTNLIRGIRELIREEFNERKGDEIKGGVTDANPFLNLGET